MAHCCSPTNPVRQTDRLKRLPDLSLGMVSFQHVQKQPKGTEFNRAKTTIRELTRIKLRPRTLPRSTRTDVWNEWLEGMAKGGTVQGYFLQKLQGLLICILAQVLLNHLSSVISPRMIFKMAGH